MAQVSAVIAQQAYLHQRSGFVALGAMVQPTLLTSRAAMSLEKPCDSPSSSIDQLRTTCEKKFMVPGASHVAGASPCSTAASERDDQQPLAVVNMRSGMLPCLQRQRSAMWILDGDCCEVDGQAGHARRSLRCRARSWMVRALKLA